MDNEVTKAKELKKTNALFVLACARGYIDDLKVLLDRGADPLAVDKQKVSALHFACGQGRLEVVKFLWTRGGELDVEDSAGNSPLHYAIIGNKPSVVAFLLEKGAWVEGSNSLDDTPLHLASRKGQADIVTMLLNHGAKATLKDLNKRGLTALGEAVSAGHIAIAEELVKAGANVAVKARGFPLLHLTAANGSAAATKLLLKHAGKVNDAGNDEGMTALHCAAIAGSLEVAKLLLDAGSDSAVADVAGRQPIELAPVGMKELQKLLQPNGPPKTPTVSLKAPQAPKNVVEDFKALDQQGRLARIQRWADVSDAAQLDKALLEFPLELKTQIFELQRLRQITNIQQAVVELLEDDGFQKLGEHPNAKRVVEEVHTNREAFRKYAENNEVMDLLRCLQRFQAVVRANGGHQVPFQSLLRSSEAGYQETSIMRLKGMRLMLAARQRAAVAAALADSEAEAKANAAKEMDLDNQPRKSKPQAAGSQSDSGHSSQKQALNATKPEAAHASSTSRTLSKVEEIQPDPIFQSDQIQNETGGRRQPLTLKLLGREMLRSLRNSLLIFAAFLVFMYVTTGKAPWESIGEENFSTELDPQPVDGEL